MSVFSFVATFSFFTDCDQNTFVIDDFALKLAILSVSRIVAPPLVQAQKRKGIVEQSAPKTREFIEAILWQPALTSLFLEV